MDLIRLGVGGRRRGGVLPVARGRLLDGRVTVGRAPECALRVEHDWMPRRLMYVEPDGAHWALFNGDRTRCRVTAPGVEAVVAPGRQLLLGDGHWRLRWHELDNAVDVRLELGVESWPDRDAWPLLTDQQHRDGGYRALLCTAVAGEDLAAVLTPLRRYRLAVLFRHVIEGRPAPNPFLPPAAAEAGCSMQVLKNLLHETRERLNCQRGLTLDDYDSLGYYLVHTTGVIRAEHLSGGMAGVT